jgi:hypothetical protein
MEACELNNACDQASQQIAAGKEKIKRQKIGQPGDPTVPKN